MQDIISQVEVEIEETDHVGTLHDKLSEAGSALLIETLPKLLDGSVSPVKQDEEQATFAWNIKREQEKIDWTKSGKEVYNHIRGLHPWPVAYTTLAGSVMKIWWGEKVKGHGSSVPGEVLAIEEDGFIVSTGDDISIKVTDLQPSGKKRMSAKDYLRGAGSHLTVGDRIGEEHE